MSREPYLNDAQLAMILTSILDILTSMNTAYANDHGQTDAITEIQFKTAYIKTSLQKQRKP